MIPFGKLEVFTMKTLLTLIVIVFAIWRLYGFLKDPTEHITVASSTVTVDAGDFVAELSVTGEYKKTYMIFGGTYFKDKQFIRSISLSGLRIAYAKRIYARYPDFHLCASPGAALAQPKVESLDLIPVDKRAFNELLDSVNKHQENFANGDERICVSLSGKTLSPDYTDIVGKNSTEEMRYLFKIPQGSYYLINSAKILDCKNLLS